MKKPARTGWLVLAAVAGFAIAAGASAHEGSTSYLTVAAAEDESRLEGRWDVALIDIAWSLPLDGNRDGRLTWSELEAGQEAIAALLSRSLALSRSGRPCRMEFDKPWLTERLGLPYYSIDYSAACHAGGRIDIAASQFFDRDAYHRVLVAVSAPAAAYTATLAPGARRWSQPAAPSGWDTARAFLWQGMWHVWIGFDHLIFLLLLLLPSVLARGDRAGRSGRATAIDLARIVTAFTIAHSITLALAATAVIRLPQRPIEVAVALSLVVAGCLNLAPRLLRFRLPVAFGFGLVHGFGFANALAGLETRSAGVLPVLGGFNLGVELGNLAVIAAALPVLLWIRRYHWYAPRAVPALSLAAAAVGAAWMLQRL